MSSESAIVSFASLPPLTYRFDLNTLTFQGGITGSPHPNLLLPLLKRSPRSTRSNAQTSESSRLVPAHLGRFGTGKTGKTGETGKTRARGRSPSSLERRPLARWRG